MSDQSAFKSARVSRSAKTAAAQTSASTSASARSALSLYLAFAYLLLIVLASLSPFTGWRATGAPMFAFLFERNYSTRFDLLINFLGYAPIGFLLGMCALSRLRPAVAVLLASFGGALLSLAMESLQSYLPTRTSSAVDLFCNSSGAIAGALLAALLGRRLLESRRLSVARHRFFYPGDATPAGLVLLALWLLSQANPSIPLFGIGDLRIWLDEETAGFHSAQFFIWIEAAVVALNLLGTGLLAANLTANIASAGRLIIALLVAVFAIKSLAVAAIVDPARAFAWLTFGAWLGLLAGGGGLIFLARLRRGRRFVIAFACLALAILLVNLSPQNPYLISSFELWRDGQYLNLNASTRFVSTLWPFAALLYLATRFAHRESRYT